MPRIRQFPTILVMALAIAASACASTRGVSVGSNSERYRVEVVNQLPRALTVFWSDGGEPRQLGSVSSGQTEQFVIAEPRTMTVSITARNADGAQAAGPYSINLETGVIKRVVLR